uniref:Peptidase S54 rhomboid domain-containing protein n=1 Tax=Octopus bimaculoides TaxID=37653 RepID=A0A0L8HD61_OCTBM
MLTWTHIAHVCINMWTLVSQGQVYACYTWTTSVPSWTNHQCK